MRLESIQIEKYRSITKTQTLALDKEMTVILGPNNEGKSNLLRAVVLAIDCLKFIRPHGAMPSKQGDVYRVPNEIYDWDKDFPQTLKSTEPEGETVLNLNFSLNDDEQAIFQNKCKVKINENLPVEIRLDRRVLKFKVRKPGKGAKTFKENSSKVAAFILSTFSFQYIPAIRPERLSLDVVGNLVERELAILSEDQNYRDALKTIDALQKPVFDRLGQEMQLQLKRLLPSVRKVKILSPGAQPEIGRYRELSFYPSRFRQPQFIIDDGVETPLEAKGDGIKSLTAISLMRASKAGGKVGSLAVAIEEPEAHLHPSAVRGLANVLQDMSKEHQVIITTHSPLLVARQRLTANIVVSKSKATPAKSIKEIRQVLGVQVADNLTVAEYVLLVEGQTDIDILTAIFSHKSAKFKGLLADRRLVFDDMGGAGNVASKIESLRLNVASSIVILDDDKAGREAHRAAGEKAQLNEKYLFTWRRPTNQFKGSELEDLIDPEVYWRLLQSDNGVVLDKAVFNGSDLCWSDRIKLLYEAAGKKWTKSAETNLKRSVAKAVLANPEVSVKQTYVGLIDSVLTAICNLVEQS